MVMMLADELLTNCKPYIACTWVPYNRSRKHRVNIIKWLNAIWIADHLPPFVGIGSSQLANNYFSV
jgi:hypothetical protein